MYGIYYADCYGNATDFNLVFCSATSECSDPLLLKINKYTLNIGVLEFYI